MDPARKLATYDDILALPEDAKGEVVHGTLKARLYAVVGVPSLWLIDPSDRVLEALVLDGQPPRRQCPDLPPSFSSSITASTVIPRSIALHMS